MTEDRIEHPPWPARAGLLLALGAALGLAFHFLVRGSSGDATIWGNWTDDRLRLSLATFVALSGMLFAFTLERLRWWWSAGFALAGGAILGLVFYWNGDPNGSGADQVWRFVSGLLAVAIAAPLFQTMRDEGDRRLPYRSVHAHSWTNVVLWFAAWLFVLLSWLLAWLLAALFHLIGLNLLKDLLEKDWFAWMLTCGALGAGIGLLRDRDRVLGLLQRVVTTVLAFLAPFLAAGLVLFVLALPFTGLAPLWEQTRATTPILLSCVIGAIVLVNAVIGNAPWEEAKARPLRWSAMALAAVMLPLAVVAALSTGQRIAQHGFTPSRLWAASFILIAAAYATLYLLALLGRSQWSSRIRRFNLALAFGVCGLALLLATPLVKFGAISTRDQVARLESGRVAPERFDWAALRFDFGPSGRAALERLRTQSRNAGIRSRATAALATERRWDLPSPATLERRSAGWRNVRVVPAGTSVPPILQDLVSQQYQCGGEQRCLLYYAPGETIALLVSPDRYCSEHSGSGRECEADVREFYRSGEAWIGSSPPSGDRGQQQERNARIAEGLRQGQAEIRTVPRRQLFVGGEPVGEPFE